MFNFYTGMPGSGRARRLSDSRTQPSSQTMSNDSNLNQANANAGSANTNNSNAGGGTSEAGGNCQMRISMAFAAKTSDVDVLPQF